jgi:hypothetical protein
VHPYVGQALAAERIGDWRRRAAVTRRARRARNTRHGIAEISTYQVAVRDQVREVGRARTPRSSELEGAGRNQRPPVGAGRA